MKLVLLTIRSSQEDWSSLAGDLYKSKLSHFCEFDHVELRSNKQQRSQKDEKRKVESEMILEKIEPSDFVILFDEKGKAQNSREFSNSLTRVLESGKRRAVFVIGGAFGVNEELFKRADLKVSLSNMVYNHHVAKTVALEQIYRAFTIIKNIPYHND